MGGGGSKGGRGKDATLEEVTRGRIVAAACVL